MSGIILGAGGMWLVGSYHLVRTSQQLMLVPRTTYSWTDSYVDIRGWDFRTWRQHPALAEALFRSGRRDLLPLPPAEPPRRWFPSPRTGVRPHAPR